MSIDYTSLRFICKVCGSDNNVSRVLFNGVLESICEHCIVNDIANFRCKRCLQLKSADDFSINVCRFLKRSIVCKECLENERDQIAQIKKHQSAILASQKATEKAIQKANQSKRYISNVKVDGCHTYAEREMLYDIQEGKCFYCGCDIAMGYYVEGTQKKGAVDHFIPISKGGSNTIDNLVYACEPCNNFKRAKMPRDFMGDNFRKPPFDKIDKKV